MVGAFYRAPALLQKCVIAALKTMTTCLKAETGEDECNSPHLEIIASIMRIRNGSIADRQLWVESGRSVTLVNDPHYPAMVIHLEATARATRVGAVVGNCGTITLPYFAVRFAIPEEPHRCGASLSEDYDMVARQVPAPDLGMPESFRNEEKVPSAQRLGVIDPEAIDDMGIAEAREH
jgi:hypothetical protein